MRVIQFKTGARQLFEVISQGNEMGQFHSLQFSRKACTQTHTHTKSMHMQTQLVCNYDLLHLSFFLHTAQTKDILVSFRNETQISYYRFQNWNMYFASGTTSMHRAHWNNHDSCSQQPHQALGWPIWSLLLLYIFSVLFYLSFLWIFFCITGSRTQLSLLLSMPCAKCQIH